MIIAIIARFNVKYVFVIAWLVLIFFMSNQTSTTSSGLSSIFVEPVRPYALGFADDLLTRLVRKSAHIFMYFILGILVFIALRDHIVSKKLLITCSILFAFTFAITDEIHQLFVTGRSGELRDVFIDTIGATLGVLVYVGALSIIDFSRKYRKAKQH